MIMAGGTGGHVMPGLAVAYEMRARSWDVVWLGNPTGMEAELVPRHDIPMRWVRIGGLRGKGLATRLAMPFRLLRACWQALRVLRDVRPSVVLGMGGYVAFPGGLVASLLRRPLVIHEQNAVAGMTNRWLSHLAGTVAEAFPGSFGRAGAVVTTGNPVRREIAGLPPPEQRFAGRSGRLRLLVVGGSQGAAALNRLVPRAVAALPDALRPLVLHQAGPRELEATTALYRELGVEADVRAFVDDMAAAYGAADFALTRSGALTVSELAAAGLGALLVPFPAAVDDHQASNAAFLVEAGAARMLREAELTPERLARELLEVLEGGRERPLAMARAARRVAVTDAAERLAGLCIAAAEGRA